MPSSPTRNSQPPSAAPCDNPGAQLAGQVIVLLEDDELVRRATERMLRRFGARVVTGRSSGEVLAAIAAQELTPSCVIADYWLSGEEDGLAAANVVCETVSGPVQGLIITGDLSQAVAESVAGAGFKLLRKPVNVDSFLDAITISS